MPPAEPSPRLLVTRPRDRAAALLDRLEQAGYRAEARSPIALAPPLDPEPVQQVLGRLNGYDWLLFTSVNGVRFFLRALGDRDAPALRVACVGAATAGAWRTGSGEPEVVARDSRAEGLIAALSGRVTAGERVLWVRPERARPVLQEALRAAGALVDAVAFYRNVPSDERDEIVEAIAAGSYDVIVLTAPSTLERLLETDRSGVREALAAARLVAVGPVTGAAVRDAGLPLAATAGEPSPEGILGALATL